MRDFVKIPTYFLELERDFHLLVCVCFFFVFFVVIATPSAVLPVESNGVKMSRCPENLS